MADQSVETEVKVRCEDFERLRDQHPELGWTVIAPRHFEDNIVFDLPESALANRGSILRMRMVNSRATLTYKGMLPASDASVLKVREELEVGIEHPAMMIEILSRLGLAKAFRYQKYRTVFGIETSLGSALAMFDETPFGSFLEIEGEEPAVVNAAAVLGFEESAFIRQSYIGLQAALCRARGVPLEDLVFSEEQG